MQRLLRLAALALLELVCNLSPAQVTVSPIVNPHVTFVDGSGAPCAGCKFYSYAAGTTTPLATYTDAGGVSTNTNPIVLDTAGGANIWLANTGYKFVLKTSTGTTIWTVDQVKGGGGLGGVCGPAGAVQIADSAVTGLTCDTTITINTSTHTLNVGTLTTDHVTIGALSVPTTWTLDTTTPNTALLSLGPVPLSDVETIAADSTVMNATGSSASPTAVALPSGCTNGVNYSTSTHTWTCASTSIPLANLAPQAADTVVMNATGGSASPTAVAMPSSCTNGINYDTSTHAWACLSGGGAPTCNSNGCYITIPGGTIVQWGQAAGCSTSNNTCNTTVTFPTSFTTTTNLIVTASCQNWGNCAASTSSPSTSAVTITEAPFVIVGGSGNNLPGTQVVPWIAIGQ